VVSLPLEIIFRRDLFNEGLVRGRSAAHQVLLTTHRMTTPTERLWLILFLVESPEISDST